MTRETKIGLLVGLAFIIVIGILLSDYNRIETPTAPLFGDNTNLRKGVGTPTAADNKSQGDHHDTIVYPVTANSPRQQVPTHEDLAPPQGNSDVVVISPFDGAHPTRSTPTIHRNMQSPRPAAAKLPSISRTPIFRRTCRTPLAIMERNWFPSGRMRRAPITALQPQAITRPPPPAANTQPKPATRSARWPAASWAATRRPTATRSSPPILRYRRTSTTSSSATPT